MIAVTYEVTFKSGKKTAFRGLFKDMKQFHKNVNANSYMFRNFESVRILRIDERKED